MAEQSMPFVQRQRSTGSRPASDINDRFLEKIGFYRKHAPTDSSCLFRVVSELEHGVQIYHSQMRRICVEYMQKNRILFAKDIKWNFKSYLENMALSRSYGSILELKALAMYYNVNVFLFEPLTHGRWILQSKTAKSTWRLFRGRDNHFDAVYSLDYMKEAAYCQALMYEIVYKNVLRMPDVEYAVERMLYDPDDTKTTYSKNDQGRTIATTSNGRQLVMSVPEDTHCMLADYRLCHFHHGANFSRVRNFFSVHGTHAGYRLFGEFASSNFRQGNRKPNPLLYDRNVSCVRQLLDMRITPFAYKTAKSLDPNIYRNVEFDSWIYSIKTPGMLKNKDFMFEVGMKCLYQVDGSLKVCRIETIWPENCLLRMDGTTGLTTAQLRDLKPYHPHKLGTQHCEPAQTSNIGESPSQGIQALQPAIEPAQSPAAINEAPPPVDANAQMLMQMTMPMPAQQPIVNWQTIVGPLGMPLQQLIPMVLREAVQPNIGEQSILYRRLASAPPVPMYPAVWDFADTRMSPINQQELYQETRQLQQQQQNVQQQQLLNYQQQLQQHHPMQFQQWQLPMSNVLYQHRSNCPVQNRMFDMSVVVPVDTTQHQHLSQQTVGYESVIGAGPARYMHNDIHYQNNAPNPANSASAETMDVTMPYSLDSENARVCPGNIFFY